MIWYAIDRFYIYTLGEYLYWVGKAVDLALNIVKPPERDS